uniref:hypothetical protein n=1 Tax=Cryobacterium sp. Y50 TaxID=2048286 RepID=UPI001E61174D
HEGANSPHQRLTTREESQWPPAAPPLAIFGTNGGSEPHDRVALTASNTQAYGFFGFMVAIAALTGGVLLIASSDRHLAKSAGSRTALAALGATGGVLVLGIVFATVQWAIGANGWAYLLVMFTVALAIAAGIVAAFLVYRAERRSERTQPERARHPLPSAWVDF